MKLAEIQQHRLTPEELTELSPTVLTRFRNEASQAPIERLPFTASLYFPVHKIGAGGYETIPHLLYGKNEPLHLPLRLFVTNWHEGQAVRQTQHTDLRELPTDKTVWWDGDPHPRHILAMMAHDAELRTPAGESLVEPVWRKSVVQVRIQNGGHSYVEKYLCQVDQEASRIVAAHTPNIEQAVDVELIREKFFELGTSSDMVGYLRAEGFNIDT